MYITYKELSQGTARILYEQHVHLFGHCDTTESRKKNVRKCDIVTIDYVTSFLAKLFIHILFGNVKGSGKIDSMLFFF